MKIAIISRCESDLEAIISKYAETVRIDPDEKCSLAEFDACALLGGVDEAPLILPIDLKLQIEAFRDSGRPLFAEWCFGVGYAYMDEGTAQNTVSQRMIYVGEEKYGLEKGDLLDERANRFIGYAGLTDETRPILCLGGHIIAHDRASDIGKYKKEEYALWYLDKKTLVCSFRLCNYVKARFAPHERWDVIASLILVHLLGEDIKVETSPSVSMDHSPVFPEDCFKKGIDWIEKSGILLEDGESGVLEGFSHHILPDGRQLDAKTVRNDCSGEIGGALFFDAYLNSNESSRARFKKLQRFCFEKMYEDKPPFVGMMRWSTVAWNVCYQDDVARTLLGTLLSMQLGGDRGYLGKVCGAMDFLLGTTGNDGLRVSRTDSQFLTDERIAQLKSSPSCFPCAHHNAYYMATLLLTHILTGEQRYFDAAVKGIESLMAVFPNTIREHSETQELCRLILPLAILYETTGEKKHEDWLYLVSETLEKYRDERGGYLEHDTGYLAKRSRTSGTESSLLADNGDPVQDLLYSVNWLPLGFAYAFKATGDARFLERWRALISFLSEIQTESDTPRLNGSWCRAIDSSRREAYGMPHDVGWGPCAVESGWTVGEILMGIGYGLAIGMNN